MKKNAFLLVFLLLATLLKAQSCYWVALTDKAGTTFDPYSYFDAKAIERYRLNHADLYDITNYPLNADYVSQIDDIAIEEVGQSRWLNAVAVMATDEQMARIAQLPFVRETVLIGGGMQTAQRTRTEGKFSTTLSDTAITDQLLRMQGQRFIEQGIDGTGIRIAVFDGGFHAVNTHQAFKHLRDAGRIMATWDFTKKQENVYDNHTHGTMVLSCIAGKLGDKQLGLATGATFLLAKTEVEPEPFKEEVWWAQAVEWADKNGADIINSSLGYTKDRHYTWEMDGRSYVSRAANIAARKGMLVCNSAGNSGDERNWKIIGAPADADSILSVGGISPSLTTYQHISFSSYGPTADKRMKPNVCNYGYCEVADPHDDNNTEFAAGTSFSSPLTAGFCACAWQTMRDRTAMQMKQLIEESADLYPYYDYAFGYGVPQADYFLDESKRIIEPAATFEFKSLGKYVLIHPLANKASNHGTNLRMIGRQTDDEQSDGSVVLFKLQGRKGIIERYVNLKISQFDEGKAVAIPKSAIYGYTLVAYVDGFTNEYHLSKFDSISEANSGNDRTFKYHVIDTVGYYLDDYRELSSRKLADNNVTDWGVGQKHLLEVYAQYGLQWYFGKADLNFSDGANIGIRYLRHFKKWYALGLGLEIAGDDYRYEPNNVNNWDNYLNLGGADFSNAERKTMSTIAVNLELFQRIRLKAGGTARNKGLHWDIGVFGGLLFNNYNIYYNENENADRCLSESRNYSELDNVGNFNWGVTSRMVWDWIGIYGRYRFTQRGLGLPHLELGVQFSF